MIENIIIRKGTEDDVTSLLQLIRELAEYEKAPGEVIITAEQLKKDGFGKDKLFSFFIAEKNGTVAGIALYYEKYSTWKGRCIFLEDIIITRSFRRQGIGTMLFLEVAAVARDLGVQRLEWQVLEWNDPAIEFYKKLGAQLDGEWINCKLNYNQLRHLL